MEAKDGITKQVELKAEEVEEKAVEWKNKKRYYIQQLSKPLWFFGLILIIPLILPHSASAVPSFARQTGLACDTCHTVFPHLTPFGRDFKLHGYTYDYSELIKAVREIEKNEAKEERGIPNLVINKIPMLSVRIVSMFNEQVGGSSVPSGKVTAGQGLVSAVDEGYSDESIVHIVRASSLFVAGEVAPNIGTFLEFTGPNDTGSDTFGVGFLDLVLLAPSVTVHGHDLTFGVRATDSVGADDPSNAVGNFGLTTTLMGMSTHATLFDPYQASVIVGGEAYAMLGGFSHGGIYGAFGIFHPTNSQTDTSYVTGNLTGEPSTFTDGNFTGAKNVDEYGRLSFWLPGYKNIYSEIGGFGYHGSEGMSASPGANLTEPDFTDSYYNFGIDTQTQWIADKHLVELFAVYQRQHDSKFFDQDLFTGTFGQGESVTRQGFAIEADYYYRRTYGVYARYFYEHSSQVEDVNVGATVLGLSWYPYENVNLRVETALFNRYNRGSAQFGEFAGGSTISPSDIGARHFDVIAVKLEYLF
jgi:iron:rusticyanin reductase